jgi:glycerol-3-phosphate dehydrogenase
VAARLHSQVDVPVEQNRSDRDRAFAGLSAERFDLVIVGGGITGAALACLATSGPEPLRVALIERAQLAAGTSSRSSKFLHGGLRYLAHGRLGLVRRLLAGRAQLAALAPHLVSPAPFLLPLGPRTPHPAWVLRAALRVYGALEHRGPYAPGVAPTQHLDRAAALRAEPLAAELARDGALGYGELAVNDAGLVEELARRAEADGARVVTGVACDGLARAFGRVVGVDARDASTGARFVLRGRVVVDATGPWSGRLAIGAAAPDAARPPLRLSRGTHVVVPAERLPLARTLVFFGPRDGRALFASPRGAHVLVGTTEVEHCGSPDDVAPTREEVAYLLKALAVAVPAARLGWQDVGAAFAGVRPLPAAGGDPGALDRGYVVAWDEPGLLAVRGGKLTLALDGARSALRALGAEAKTLGLPPIAIPPFGALCAPGGAAGRAERRPALQPVREPVTWRAA